MKTIFRIAKTELRYLFYSPIAWFIMIVFLVQCGIVYTNNMGSYAKMQDMGGDLGWVSGMTSRIFLGDSGLFTSVMQNLYLYIPLLTMGLVSRETSSGTIKLLYSSPINVREIILGKFLSMMIYNLLLVAIIGIFIVSGIFQIKSTETGMLLSAALGFYLLLCAYSAIGLFMSCLTTYQIVAAVSTFLMIGILYFVGTLWQDIDIVRELTYFLSISGRTEKMLRGLITTKDIIYYIVIVYIFLGISIYKLKSGMESKSAVIQAARYFGIVASALLIGYVSSISSLIGYYDATSTKERTLTPNAQKIIKELGDEPLEVTVYNNILSKYWSHGSFFSYNYNQLRWEPYMRFKKNITLKTVRYYDTPYDDIYLMRSYPGKTVKQIAQNYAKNNDVKFDRLTSPEEIRKIIDLKPELNRFVMQLKYKGKTTFLRVFDDMEMWPGETEVSAALKRLMQARIPKIAFLTGNLERDINKIGDREYKSVTTLSVFRLSLMNQGFDVDTVSVETQEIPTDISTLVIADPKLEFDHASLEKIKKYIDKGGNLMIAGEPGKQAVLNPILAQLGVQILNGTMIQQSKDFAPNLVTPLISDLAASFSKAVARSQADSMVISMSGVAGLSYEANGAYNIKPLLLTDGKLTWNRKQELDLEMMTSADAASNNKISAAVAAELSKSGSDLAQRREKVLASSRITFNPADGDIRGPIPTMLRLTRKINGKEQRIIVSGDADFLSNSEIRRGNMKTANFVLNTALFSWLNYGQYPIDTSRPKPNDTKILVTRDQVDVLKIIYVWVLPALLLLSAAVLLLRRKRQ